LPILSDFFTASLVDVDFNPGPFPFDPLFLGLLRAADCFWLFFVPTCSPVSLGVRVGMFRLFDKDVEFFLGDFIAAALPCFGGSLALFGETLSPLKVLPTKELSDLSSVFVGSFSITKSDFVVALDGVGLSASVVFSD
jgi:hypothetical protein